MAQLVTIIIEKNTKALQIDIMHSKKWNLSSFEANSQAINSSFLASLLTRKVDTLAFLKQVRSS